MSTDVDYRAIFKRRISTVNSFGLMHVTQKYLSKHTVVVTLFLPRFTPVLLTVQAARLPETMGS